MPPLQRTVLTWPLTGGVLATGAPSAQPGGLDTWTAPMKVKPGSYIDLVNVRQERRDEWRMRRGYVQQDAPPSAPVRVGRAGNNIFAAFRETGIAPAFRFYTPSMATKWKSSISVSNTDTIGDAQYSPCSWTRTPGFTQQSANKPLSWSFAQGVLSRVFAYSDGSRVYISTRFLAEDIQSRPPQSIGGFTGTRPRCAYVAGWLCVFYIDGSQQLQVVRIDDTTAQAVTTGALATSVDATTPFLDAIVYPYSTRIDVVVKLAASSSFQQISFDPAANSKVVDQTRAINCDFALGLIPYPSDLGLSYAGVVIVSSGTITATNNVSVSTYGPTGTFVATDLISGQQATQIAGCWCNDVTNNKAGWMLCWQDAITGTLYMCKKNNATVGAVSNLLGGAQTTAVYLDSNAWREPGTDLMRFIVGYHSGNAADPQDSYFEMAVGYSNGTTDVNSTNFIEPQARILTDEAAGPLTLGSTLPQVTRLAADRFATCLPRLASFNRDSATLAETFALDVFQVDYLNIANLAAINQQKEAASTPYRSYLPVGSLLTIGSSGQFICGHGASTFPLKPVLTAAGGGNLDLTGTYQYCVVVSMLDENGFEWRSPTSVPAQITLTGSNRTVSVVCYVSPLESQFRLRTIELYRTEDNGSVFRRVTSITQTVQAGDKITFTDTVADATLVAGDILYTTSEIENALTPRFSHVAFFDNRLWGINADFRDEVWYSKQIIPGRLPEFVPAFVFKIADELGDLTGIAACNDKIVFTKANGTYYVGSGGPDATGANTYAPPLRLSSDIGHKAGAPLVSTGSEVFLIAQRGIMRLSSSLAFDFVGLPVDKYINQPSVQTPSIIYSAVYLPLVDEIRYLAGPPTTNAIAVGMLVYDRKNGLWVRDTLANGQQYASLLMVQASGKMALLTPDPLLWLEGDDTVAADAGFAYNATIRSAWITPATPEGWCRLYKGRVLGSSLAGGGVTKPIFSIYRDYDESLVQTFQPSSPFVTAGLSPVRAEGLPTVQKCTAFSFAVQLAQTGDRSAMRLEQWAAEVGVLPGAQKLDNAKRWT